MRKFYTSDTHFGHENVIKYCNRPFASVDEMDRVMVENWNAVVNVDDEVWHLGDFSFKNGSGFLHTLNGHKYLIAGNHDRSKIRNLTAWKEVHRVPTYVWDGPENNRVLICLRHKPFSEPAEWAPATWHFHGHSHSTLAGRRKGNRIDVGVDPWGFTPRTFEELTA